VALTKAILPAKLLLCNMYHDIAQRANWNSFVLLSTATILGLKDWCHSLSTWNGCLANLQPCNILLNTKASLAGWGASLGAMMSSPTHTSAGWWPWSKQHHINVLKITTVYNALKSFLPLLQGKVVRVCCNNIATMAHLNHMGGRSPLMNCIMHKIHHLCESSHIQLTATYLLGADNTVADHLSHLWEKIDWQEPRKFDCQLVWTIFIFYCPLSIFTRHWQVARKSNFDSRLDLFPLSWPHPTTKTYKKTEIKL